MLRVGMKLRLDFNQLPLKKQKRSFHVLLINKSTAYILGYFWQKSVFTYLIFIDMSAKVVYFKTG